MPGFNLRRKQIIFRVIILLIIAGMTVAGVWGVAHLCGFSWFDLPVAGVNCSMEDMETLIRSWGMWGVAGSMGLMVLHSLVPFPAEIITMANGMIYGPLWGAIISWAGAMLGAFLAFGLSKMAGRPLVETLVSPKNWTRIEQWAQRQGTSTLLASRFIPVISFNLINYAAGLTPVSWRTFAWTTALGILPMTLLISFTGHGLKAMPWHYWLITIGVAVMIYMIFHLRRKKSQR